MKLRQIHHVAYRCRDAKETVEWYRDKLDMDFLVAISEDRVPSTKEPDPYMHVFLDAGNGNILAFFDLPNSPAMGRDENTPAWVQHIAFELDGGMEALVAAKAELESKGVDVLGPTDHGIIQSLYFFDPNGHRLELTVRVHQPGELEQLADIAPQMLEAWSKKKVPLEHARWLHEKEFGDR